MQKAEEAEKEVPNEKEIQKGKEKIQDEPGGGAWQAGEEVFSSFSCFCIAFLLNR